LLSYCYSSGKPVVAAGAAVRRTHGRHAPILLDFYRDRLIFSRFT
jgi:hypothetical protein